MTAINVVKCSVNGNGSSSNNTAISRVYRSHSYFFCNSKSYLAVQRSLQQLPSIHEQSTSITMPRRRYLSFLLNRGTFSRIWTILSIDLRDRGDHIKSVNADELNSGTLRASASSMDMLLRRDWGSGQLIRRLIRRE